MLQKSTPIIWSIYKARRVLTISDILRISVGWSGANLAYVHTHSCKSGENSRAVSQKGMQIQRCSMAIASRFEKEKEKCQRGNFENEEHEAVI
jgi:hypothetical protein